MLNVEAINTNFSLWFDPIGLEPMIYCTRGEQTHWDLNPWSTAREESKPIGTWTHDLLRARRANPLGLEPMIYCTGGEQTHWDSTPWSTAREESTITITRQMWFLIQIGNTLYNTWWVYNLNIAFIKTFRSTAFRTPVDDSTSSVSNGRHPFFRS